MTTDLKTSDERPVLSRRSFLKLAGAAAIAGLIVPAWTPPRAPYVHVGQVVDYIGPAPHGFIGSTLVQVVGEWDSIGYPVTLAAQSFYRGESMPHRIYDFDLCTLCDEYPADFWHHEENRRLYNNVHTYVRTKRFGETIAEAVIKLNFVSSRI